MDTINTWLTFWQPTKSASEFVILLPAVVFTWRKSDWKIVEVRGGVVCLLAALVDASLFDISLYNKCLSRKPAWRFLLRGVLCC